MAAFTFDGRGDGDDDCVGDGNEGGGDDGDGEDDNRHSPRFHSVFM